MATATTTNTTIPNGWISVPGTDAGLYFDPTTGTFMQQQAAPAPVANQWAWGDMGIQGLGGATQLGIDTSFLGIDPRYASGAPITADTWQQAVSNSLTGFVRDNYGLDPIFNWVQGQSGLTPGSQYKLGTLQDLANSGFGFFDTSGPLMRNVQTGTIVNPTQSHWSGVTSGGFDPLLGLDPTQKMLGFEDVPLQQIEKAVGSLQGSFLNPHYIQWNQQNNSRTGKGNPYQQYLSLSQLQADKSLQDYNDLMFALDINQYAPPAPITTADPRAVMQQFFNTAPYQLAFGNDPNVLNPNLSPTQRFRADPGYQFTQNEGQRQLQFDQSKNGLLESGRGQRDMLQFSQNLADQNYQRWLAQNQSLFQNWQQGIAGVMNAGNAATGQMSQNNMTLAQLLGNASLNTGNNLANTAGQTGTNIANLFGSQGIFGGSSFLNTGAAQSSNIMSAASIQAQIAAANAAATASQQSAQNASNSSAAGGFGQLAGQGLGLLGGFM